MVNSLQFFRVLKCTEIGAFFDSVACNSSELKHARENLNIFVPPAKGFVYNKYQFSKSILLLIDGEMLT